MSDQSTATGTVISFDAPDRPLNMNDRLHWARKAERVRNWRTRAMIAARQAGVLNVGPSVVLVTLSVSTAGRRDPSNWYPTVKAIVDGFTDAGAWPDDDSTNVATLEPKLVKRKGSLVEVELSAWNAA